MEQYEDFGEENRIRKCEKYFINPKTKRGLSDFNAGTGKEILQKATDSSTSGYF